MKYKYKHIYIYIDIVKRSHMHAIVLFRNKYGCLCPSVSWPPCMCARVHAPALQLSSVWVPLPKRILAPLHVCSRPRACPPAPLPKRILAPLHVCSRPRACPPAQQRVGAFCSSSLLSWIMGSMEFGCACPESASLEVRDNPESQQKVRARIHYRQHRIFMRHTPFEEGGRERETERGKGDQRLAATEQAAYRALRLWVKTCATPHESLNDESLGELLGEPFN